MTKINKNGDRIDVGPHITKSNGKRVKANWRKHGSPASLRSWCSACPPESDERRYMQRKRRRVRV